MKRDEILRQAEKLISRSLVGLFKNRDNSRASIGLYDLNEVRSTDEV